MFPLAGAQPERQDLEVLAGQTTFRQDTAPGMPKMETLNKMWVAAGQ
jgi:hypothetical protein